MLCSFSLFFFSFYLFRRSRRFFWGGMILTVLLILNWLPGLMPTYRRQTRNFQFEPKGMTDETDYLA